MAANRPMAVATSASAMPGATVASVTCVRAARPVKACMIPQTVPKRPTYGDTEPTVARNDRFCSAASSSRWKLARMARRAPSSSVAASVTWRSRSFWYSRMPEAKMRSMGPANLAFCAAEANSSFRLVPDQNSRSKSSLSTRMRLRAKYLRMMAAQLATDTITSSSTTSCTTKLAWSRRLMMERSWFMA
ncbi:hypothetical protein D3C72_1332310 [compost metagenome]